MSFAADLAMPPETSRFGHWRALGRHPALGIWALFLLLNPLYVFKSGLPQPGDWLVLLLLPVTLLSWNGTLERPTSRMVRALVWFTVWVFVVNYAWAGVTGRWSSPKDFLIHPFFYFFNLCVFLCALVLARKNKEAFLRITVEIVFVTVVVMVASSLFYRTGDYRGQLFFNSPNQFGFYALLAACLFVMAQRPLGINRSKAAIAVASCTYLAVLSASRASLAGILVLLLILLFSNPRTIIIASLAATGLVSLGGPIANALDATEKRINEDRDPETSFVEERGYDRILNNPEYLVTGAGEGAYERFIFREGAQKRELHSSFGTVVFSYGIVGIVLLGMFAIRTLRGASFRMSVVLVPTLVYTVAHQGLRFTMFWVVLAAFVIMKSMAREPGRLARSP